MALSVTKAKIMELNAVTVAKLSADGGAAPTYEASVAVPGIVKLGIVPELHQTELEGDGRLLDLFARLRSVEVELEFSEMSFPVLAAISGITQADSGSTPNQKAKLSFLHTTQFPFFKIEGQWVYAGDGIGDMHATLWKVKLTDFPALEVEHAMGDFAGMTLKGRAIPCSSDSSFFDLEANETAVAPTVGS